MGVDGAVPASDDCHTGVHMVDGRRRLGQCFQLCATSVQVAV